MSETPIAPVLEQKSEQINSGAEHRYYTAQVDRELAAWGQGFDSESRLDLNREEVLNPELWADRSGAVTQAPEYAATPKTRADEVGESLQDLTDNELRAQLDAHTKAIVNGLRRYTLAA